MSHTLLFRRSLLVLVAGGLLGLAIGAASMQNASAEVDATLQSCAWTNASQYQQKVYYAAGAFDSDNNVLYTIGGVNEQNDVQDFVQAMDYGSANDPGDGAARTRRNLPQDRYGATAFYRPNPTAGEDGYIYVIGGANNLGIDDEREGRGEDNGYVYDIDGNTWSPISFSGSALGERLFAGSAYDAGSKLAVVAGGVKQCAQKTVDDGGNCPADNLSTVFLEFDDADPTNVTLSTKAASSLQLYGHSLTAGNGKIYLHGGTRSGEQGLGNTQMLDMSDPDTANWDSAGNGPRSAFHSAAYDSVNNWVIIQGGANGRYFTPSEGTIQDTNALDTTASPPAWVDLSARPNPGDRIGATAGFVSNGNFDGMAMATGRRKFQNRDTQNAESKAEVLICGDSPTETATTPPPTAVTPTTPPGSETPTTPPETATPPPTAVPGAVQCDGLDTKVPSAVIANALSNPDTVAGWGEYCNPNIQPSPWNVLRTHLNLRNPGAPYHPTYNSVIFNCGCR